VTVDEELSLLEDSLRRLKIEYDVFFGGGSKKPPTELDFRVHTMVKKHSDSSKMSYVQRFRYNAIAQKFALFSDLWRQKLKIKEEGYRRPQDAVLGITGMRGEIERAAKNSKSLNFVLDAASDERAVEEIFHSMAKAREKSGLPPSGSMESFKKFVQGKTTQIRQQSGCESVEYTVEVQDGQVRLKAKAKR
jgi:hypothetical protein